MPKAKAKTRAGPIADMVEDVGEKRARQTYTAQPTTTSASTSGLQAPKRNEHKGMSRRLLIFVLLVTFVLSLLGVSFTNVEYRYLGDKNTTKLLNKAPQLRTNRSEPFLLVNVTLREETLLDDMCQHVDTKISRMTNVNFTRVIMERKYDGGPNIRISVRTYDMENRPKYSGNDIIVVWAVHSDGNGCVSGDVTDHQNGSYTGYIKVLWIGRTIVRVKLASAVENTCLRVNALRKYGNMVFAMQQAWGIRGTFNRSKARELTHCGANDQIFGYSKVCNFTYLNGGMDWFCGFPKQHELQCSDIQSFGTGTFDNRVISQREKIQLPGHGVFKEHIILNVIHAVNPDVYAVTSCGERSPVHSWTESHPTGFWSSGQWNFVNCYSNLQHNNITYRQCLAGKKLVIIGDSTLRQYAEYFIEHVLDLGKINMKDALGPGRSYHSNRVFNSHNITLEYFKHEMPFHNPNFPPNEIFSVPQLITSLSMDNDSDDSLILLLNYNSHFSAYPPIKFRERLQHLVLAIKRLLQLKPRAKVFIKGPHLAIDDTRWFDPRIFQLFNSILVEEFFTIRDHVVYLDIWSIMVAHNSELIHPNGNAFISQINQLMGQLC